MQTFFGSAYPGGGRLSTFDMTIPGPYNQQEFGAQTETPAPVSNLNQYNVWMAIIVLVFFLWVLNYI